MNKSPLISTKNINKYYSGKKALDNVSLDIYEGESIGIVGANGSGKTTFIDIITKLIPASSGEIKYKEGFNIQTDLGIQFQEGYWPKGVTSKSIIKYFNGYFKNIDNDEWIQNLINVFEIREFINKDLGDLSGGQKQRLNALLAVIKNPKLIVLDELITGLDSKMQKKLSEFFQETMKNDSKKTLITITHIPEEAEIFCDRLILFFNGNIFYDDTIENIIKKFGSVRNFLNQHYEGSLESNTFSENDNNLNVNILNNSIFKKIKNIFTKRFTKRKKVNGSFKYKSEMWLKNIILLYSSTFKNLRTYVYVFIIPIGLSLGLYYLSTYTQPAMFPPSRVGGFLLIPCFSIILLMNTLISEWKASIFLKRIKVSGTSKFQFLTTIWIVGISLGMLSFFINLFVYMGYGYTEIYGYDWIYQCLDALEMNGYFGLILAAFLLTCISMGVSTILAGSISSIGITQSLAILITVLFIATSDVFLPTTTIAGSNLAVDLAYLNPTRYASWVSIIMTNHANINWEQNSWLIFNTDSAMIESTYKFSFTNIWVPIIASIGWIICLFGLSSLTFRWSTKK